MSDINYATGEIVFTKGDESLYAYLIETGEIEILRGFPENPVRLATLKEGAIFGEMGLVDERPRLLTARAVSGTVVHQIDRDGFVDMIKSDPESAFRYLRMFFERLRAMNMRVPHEEPAVGENSERPLKYVVKMYPKSPVSSDIVSAEGIEILTFPYRVGRGSGSNDPFEINDLTLLDTRPFNVSRNHFSIESEPDGIYVHDRGSFLGTIVNDKVIGGHHKKAKIKLSTGSNLVVAGSRLSPFRFQIDVTAE